MRTTVRFYTHYVPCPFDFFTQCTVKLTSTFMEYWGEPELISVVRINWLHGIKAVYNSAA